MFRTRWPRISLARKGVGSSHLTCHHRTALLARRPFASSNECSVKVRLLPSAAQGWADGVDGDKHTIRSWPFTPSRSAAHFNSG